MVVNDSGSGIPREARETVFQPYISTKTSGTGLGLAITRQIVEAHGGTIEIMEAPGGSFLITLPKRRSPSSARNA
jgi:signal transduction histidine kinase